MEKVLPYDRSIVRQETPYNCGPASTQIVLNSRGINLSESSLASEIEALEGNVGWNDQDGTDYIGQVATVLERHAPAGWQVVNIPGSRATKQQEDALWDHLVRAVNANFGLVGNIIAPPSNFPNPVAPSTQRLQYSGSTIFHYVSLMGYSDEGGIRKVWWGDPGFAPFGSWVSLEQTASLIAGKGYAWPPAASPSAPPPPPPPPAHEGLNAAVLAAAMGCSVARAQEMLPGYIVAMRAANITNVNRAAMWAAQIGHESAGLVYMEEIASGDAYEGRIDLGNTQPGDGRKFKGSGPIQLTGRANFTKFSQWAYDGGHIDSPRLLVDRPELVRQDSRLGFLAASWYWTVARPGINSMCDRGDLEGVTRAINGGLNGINDRRDRWNRCLTLGDKLLPNYAPVKNAIEECAGANPWVGPAIDTAEFVCPDGVGRGRKYQNAMIYWTPDTGAKAIPLELLMGYAQYKFETGPLGYPTRDHSRSGNGWVQAFQKGVLLRKDDQSEARIIYGRIGDYFAQTGWETGFLGWPTSNEVAIKNGVAQRFENGTVFFSPDGTPCLLNPKE